MSAEDGQVSESVDYGRIFEDCHTRGETKYGRVGWLRQHIYSQYRAAGELVRAQNGRSGSPAFQMCGT